MKSIENELESQIKQPDVTTKITKLTKQLTELSNWKVYAPIGLFKVFG